MLKKLTPAMQEETIDIKIRDAGFPAPFSAGLEYSPPARGTWNIVHTGMLIPESHQIFVCAYGCLRGVVLTAAEMNALDRYSSIAIGEGQVLDGGMEALMIDGVSEIIEKLPAKPRAILLFISCQHFFLAYDQPYVFRTLQERFPEIDFIDCYMIPTLRKSGLTPDQKMRIQMYRGLRKTETDPKQVNLIGSNLPLYEASELKEWLTRNGIRLMQIQDCHTYDEYKAMGNAALNLYYEPLAKMAAEDMKERLGIDAFCLPFVFDLEKLEEAFRLLAGRLSLPAPDLSAERKKAEEAIRHAGDVIGGTRIVIDQSFTFRPLSFARLLLEHGFHVTDLFADVFAAEEKEDFEKLKALWPELHIRPISRPEMRFAHRTAPEKILAIGQKAAYFCGTDYFVNVAESGGYFGFRGIAEIMGLMEEAFRNPKDRKECIQRKGFGCESCI